MRDGKKILAVIPARGGSKAIPRKNLCQVGGKSLLQWTIQSALAAPSLDRIILSSENEEIIAAARSAGCEVPFIRPPRLATDQVPTIEVILHALQEIPGFDWVVVLQPTSPLRLPKDIEDCLAACFARSAPVACTVVESAKSPAWMFTLGEDHRLQRVLDQEQMRLRRQDLPPVYVPNGAVYAARIDWLRRERAFITPETIGSVMPGERSVDIDSELDLAWCDFLLARATPNMQGNPA